MVSNEQVLDKYNRVIAALGADFGKWEQVKRFVLRAKEFSIDGGELTPKLSLKRKVILEKNNSVIEKLYNDSENFKG